MKIKILDQKHPTYDADEWLDLNALYEGGKAFRARIDRFLVKNPLEPLESYKRRCRTARYTSYVGAIIGAVAGAVFEHGITPKAAAGDGATPEELDEWYADFKENCDGCGTDLVDFAKARLIESLSIGKSIWRVELPPASEPVESKADHIKSGRGNATLCAIPALDLYDWRIGDDGRFLYAVIHSVHNERETLESTREMVTERWDVYDTTRVTRFEITYKVNKRPSDGNATAKAVAQWQHGFDGVPLLTLTPPDALFIGDRLREPQEGHFDLDTAYKHSLKQTAYAMPYIRTNDPLPEGTAFGNGYYLQLPQESACGFLEPGGTATSSLKDAVAEQRQEIYRITHQMAQGVDNNSSAAIGRSGESKKVDQASTNTMLTAYGASIREALKRTYDLVSAARGDTHEWDISGLSSYQDVDVAGLLEATLTAKGLAIPSKTFRVELDKRASRALLPDLSDPVRAAIDKEIEDGTHDEDTLSPMGLIPPKAAMPKVVAESDEEDEEPPSERPSVPPAKAKKAKKA